MTRQKCDFPGCGRTVIAKSLCATHYQQRRKGKELEPIRRINRGAKELCGASGCDRDARARGLCPSHYAQWLRGKPLSPLRSRPDGALWGPQRAHLPLIERIQYATKRDPFTGCLLWQKAVTSAGSGVIRVKDEDGAHNATVTNLAYDLWFGADIGSKRRVHRVCGEMRCLEPGHMYVTGLTPGWEELAKPVFSLNPITPKGRKRVIRIDHCINGTTVSTEYADEADPNRLTRFIAKMKGAGVVPTPTTADGQSWLKYLAERSKTSRHVRVHPLPTPDTPNPKRGVE